MKILISALILTVLLVAGCAQNDTTEAQHPLENFNEKETYYCTAVNSTICRDLLYSCTDSILKQKMNYETMYDSGDLLTSIDVTASDETCILSYSTSDVASKYGFDDERALNTRSVLGSATMDCRVPLINGEINRNTNMEDYCEGTYLDIIHSISPA